MVLIAGKGHEATQTIGDDVVDSFYVLDADGEKVVDDQYQREIELAILTAIAADA